MCKGGKIFKENHQLQLCVKKNFRIGQVLPPKKNGDCNKHGVIVKMRWKISEVIVLNGNPDLEQELVG